MLVAGIGMGMVWVPLFEIVIGDVRPTTRSARPPGSCRTIAAFGIVAGRRGDRDHLHGQGGPRRARDPAPWPALDGTQAALLATVGGIVLAFALGFLLPKTARAGAEH